MREDPISPPQGTWLMIVMALLMFACIVLMGLGVAGALPLWPGLAVAGLMMAVNGWNLWRAYRAQ